MADLNPVTSTITQTYTQLYNNHIKYKWIKNQLKSTDRQTGKEEDSTYAVYKRHSLHTRDRLKVTG